MKTNASKKHLAELKKKDVHSQKILPKKLRYDGSMCGYPGLV